LRKRMRNCSQSGERLTIAASLGPKVVNRDFASAESRPAEVVASRIRVDRLLPDFFGAKFAVCGVLGVIAIRRSQFSTFTRSIHWLSFL
jgi:hypothetical protein